MEFSGSINSSAIPNDKAIKFEVTGRFNKGYVYRMGSEATRFRKQKHRLICHKGLRINRGVKRIGTNSMRSGLKGELRREMRASLLE
jgi:hypothetical protein